MEKQRFILTLLASGGITIQAEDDSNEIVFDSGTALVQELLEELQDAGMLNEASGGHGGS